MSGPVEVLARPLVVLDDDPTGVQLLAGVRVLLTWNEDRVCRALASAPAVHLLTNSRALPAQKARAVVSDAAATAVRAAPDAVVVLRGDSTLRGHLLEEYLGLSDAVAPGTTPPLLLAPGLPSAGRVTVAGVHLIVQDGRRRPLHETEYARDGVFAYRTASLLDWAEERSGGFFAASNGVAVSLDSLRGEGGPEHLAAVLTRLGTRGSPAVCVPDVETDEDLDRIARGFALALRDGARAAVRCSPGLVGPLAGTTAPGLVAPPQARRVLVVCGSRVPTTARQMKRLQDRQPGTLVEADVAALLSEQSERETERVAAVACELLETKGLAVVATPTARSGMVTTLEDAERLAVSLARIVPLVEPRPDVIVAKGGVTGAVVLREGLGAEEADVVGPLLPGVGLLRVRPTAGEVVSCAIVPGNVGTDELLVQLVDVLRIPETVVS